MKCPYCGQRDDRVIDSRVSSDGGAIRRRRECGLCQRRYTTYERVEQIAPLVIKKDRRREPFSREKVLAGLLRACEKRPVPLSRLEEVVDHVERRVCERFEREVETSIVGELVVEQLKQIDKVAYIRFASVYQEYQDVSQFMHVLAPLVAEGNGSADGDAVAVRGGNGAAEAMIDHAGLSPVGGPRVRRREEPGGAERSSPHAG